MGSIPPIVLIGTAVICLGVLLHIIGMSTPHWQDVEINGVSLGYGLFRVCSTECHTFDDISSKLAATQAMVIMGMLASLVAAGTALLYVLLNLLSKNAPKLLVMLAAIASLGAFVLIIIGIIIYGASKDDLSLTIKVGPVIHTVHGSSDLGYSFALCIVGAILMAAGGVMTFLGAKSVAT